MNSKLVYFISDIHLGLDTAQHSSKDREKKLAEWLMGISSNARDIYFLGDIFDYWFEYNEASQLQFPDFFKTLRILKSKGIALHFFTGNHDMWMKDYFPDQFGIQVHHNPIHIEIMQKQFYLAHGDGLGKGDYSYKLMKMIMRNPISIFLYGLLPAKVGLGLMKYMSQKSREKHDGNFTSFDQERLLDFCILHAQSSTVNYYIMGHRHLMIDYELSKNGPRYINLGDWLKYESYATFDGKSVELKSLGNYEDEILRDI